MNEGPKDRLGYWSDPKTEELWHAARKDDPKFASTRQTPIILQETGPNDVRLLRAVAGLPSLPQVQLVGKLDDLAAETGSSVNVCAVTDEILQRLEEYTVRQDCLVNFEGKPRFANRFVPECDSPLISTTNPKEPPVLVLSLTNDDILRTIQTIEQLMILISIKSGKPPRLYTTFDLIGGVGKTGTLALLLGRARENLRYCYNAFNDGLFSRENEERWQSRVLNKTPALDESWCPDQSLDMDSPLDSHSADNICKAFAIIPHAQSTHLLCSYHSNEAHLPSDEQTVRSACYAALDAWPEDGDIKNPRRSRSNSCDDSDSDTDISQKRDFYNPIFHVYREARSIWPNRNITLVNIGPASGKYSNQQPDFICEQFRLTHRNLEEAGQLACVWIDNKHPGQDFSSYVEQICDASAGQNPNPLLS